jgi:hypothetical protein
MNWDRISNLYSYIQEKEAEIEVIERLIDWYRADIKAAYDEIEEITNVL